MSGGKTGDERTAATGDDGVGVVKPVKTAKKTTPRYKPKPEEPPKIPTVALSKEHEKTCRVFQYQQMPDAELPDLEGNTKAVKALYGQKLTVICFWSVGPSPDRLHILGLEQMLGELAAVAKNRGKKGVRVIGVNVKDSPEVAGKLLKESNADFDNLLDPEGAFFDKVATEALPRIYLLNAQGKVLWFDLIKVRSSDSSIRQLEFAIEIAVKQEQKSAGS